MDLASLPSKIFCSEIFPKTSSLTLIPGTRKSCNSFLNFTSNHKFSPQTANVSGVIHSPLSYQGLIQCRFYSRHGGTSLVAFGTENSRSGEGDHRALETVLKLYAAIKKRNISEVSDIIGEECQCVCNFISTSQPFHGKKQVLDFFSSLMMSLGNNIEFVVQPVLVDGMNVGVSWRLEWKKTHVPLGKGFSFYMCHIYQGRVVIRNVEMFMEPLLHLSPLRLKIMTFLMTVMDKTGLHQAMEWKGKRAVFILITLFFMAASMFLHSLS
ncbi:hypothetical protein F0562_018793 [Nyssa sinensis]|uniref:SnoaL-like domain-containing protein n=1 Tax=Nyssa sinensis TaxID=561372 RepID=A0A5J4ZCX8_9ASTE|nr:hypothetical protein F0562_018793 [Nyssa sinensis]